MKKSALALVFASSIFSFSASTFAADAVQETTQKAEQVVDYSQYRYSLDEMKDIANENKLAWRIFYKPSTGPNSAWFDAVKKGDLETVKKMVENGQDIEAKDEGSLNQTALGWAAFIGYEDMFDYLVSKKANLWATDKGDVYNVVKSAVLGKNVNIVKKAHALIPEFDLNDSSYEDDGESLVMVAASNNRIDIVKYLISKGVDLNKVTTIQDEKRPSYSQSALSYACQRGHTDMVKLLIENKAINHKTKAASCE